MFRQTTELELRHRLLVWSCGDHSAGVLDGCAERVVWTCSCVLDVVGEGALSGTCLVGVVDEGV